MTESAHTGGWILQYSFFKILSESETKTPLVDFDGSANLTDVRVSLTEPTNLSLVIKGDNSSLNVDGNGNELEKLSLIQRFMSWGSITRLLVGSVNETLTSVKFALPSKSTRGVFVSDSLSILKKLYCNIHPPVCADSVIVNSVYKKYSAVTLRGKVYSSSGKRIRTPYIVLADWKESLYGVPPTAVPDNGLETAPNLRPVNAHYYLEASFLVDGVCSVLHLAYVSWMFPHQHRYVIGKPAELWCRRKYESSGIHSFVPLENIKCRCAHGMMVYNEENLCVIIPLVE